jgi:predicted DsbA family dithiol-disulfide isomerase
VREEIAHARALGITSVPTFVFEGTWAVSGAQEASTFLRVLEQVAAETGASEIGDTVSAEGGNVDACADGTCAV